MLLILIAVVIDLSEKTDNFIKSEASIFMIATQYYANFIPHIAALLFQFFVLVGVVFFTSNLASRSEIIAMTSGGISFYRLMVPYLISASILGGILFYVNHYYVPNANKTRLAFEWNYLTQWKGTWVNDIHRKINDDTYFYMYNFSIENYSGGRLSLERIKDNKLTYKLNSERATWNDSTNVWTIYNYQIRTFNDKGVSSFKKGEQMDTTIANFDPLKIGVKSSSKEEMTTPELNQFIQDLIAGGQDEISYYALEKHRRTGSIYALFILTVIGYSLASRKVRGGLGLHIVSAIILAGIFELTSKFSTTYTTNAGLSAFWGIWIPNIVFTFIALIFVRFAQK
ncbi:MAG: LptF/LptG family permease [Chitinophagales bacterium]|nr:LptF/LptG family permease [Chitinophagales bacterium]